MPPVSPIAVSCLSVRFRECGLKACAFECVATRGALLIAATSQNPRSLRCDRSIKIPNRLQAPISSLPRSVRPGPVSGEEGQRNGTPWPNAFDRLQTGPRERSPASYNTSRTSKFGSIASAPSICITGANKPSSTRDDRPDAGHRHQPVACRVPTGQRSDLAGQDFDALIEPVPIVSQSLDEVQHAWRQDVCAFGKYAGQFDAQEA